MSGSTDNIVSLGAHERMTTEQALATASRQEWDDVVIVGHHKDKGDLVVLSSELSRKDCLWIAEHLKLHAMNRLD